MGIFGNRKRSTDKNTVNIKSSAREIEHDGTKITGMDQYNVWELISKLRNINNDYKYKYAEYQTMSEDVIIQSALELYADDATQVNTKTFKIVTIQSDDEMLQSDLNNFLERIHIESRVWNWAYLVSQYGDHFLKLYIDKYTGDISVDDNTDPSLIMDLFERGERVGFAEEDDSEYRNLKRKTNPQGLDLILTGPNSFVHFMIDKSAKYDTLEVPVEDETDEYGDPLIREYTIKRGVSMIEGVRSIFRILQLLEDTLLAARIAKAEYIRVFNIEVGDSTPRQTTETINIVKNLFDSKATFDINSGRYVSAKSYRPIGDPIFNPTRNGKGSVSHEDIGGEFQVKDIVDIDYFKNKLFSGLKIPKALLGFEETLPGGLGDNTLTRLDIRYSRSVKRVQNCLIVGISDLCRIWLEANGRDPEAKFTVILQAPSTAEELGRLTEFDMKMTTISNVIQNLASTYGEFINIPKVFKVLFDKYINYPELKQELDSELKEAIARYEKSLQAQELFRQMQADSIEDEIEDQDDRYDNPPKKLDTADTSNIHRDLRSKSYTSEDEDSEE